MTDFDSERIANRVSLAYDGLGSTRSYFDDAHDWPAKYQPKIAELREAARKVAAILAEIQDLADE